MKRFEILISSIIAAVLLTACSSADKVQNHNYMWFDCEANYATLSNPDSIRYYLQKSKDLGFGNVVGDWEGVERSRDYDMLGYFIEYGHEMGLKVFGSLNVFGQQERRREKSEEQFQEITFREIFNLFHNALLCLIFLRPGEQKIGNPASN